MSQPHTVTLIGGRGRRNRDSTPLRLIAALAILALCGLAMPPAQRVLAANTLTVTTTADNTTQDGQCSLREALTNVNNAAQTYTDCAAGTGTGDTINITAAGTITLASALPNIARAVTINGNGSAVSGNNTFPVFTTNTNNNNVNDVTFSMTVSNLTIQNGKLTLTNPPQNATVPNGIGGAGLYFGSKGNLTLTNVKVLNNSLSITRNNAAATTSNGGGAGVLFGGVGTLTIIGSTISGNTQTIQNVSPNTGSVLYAHAAGIYAASQLDVNTGLVLASNVVINNTTISNNTNTANSAANFANARGGGLDLQDGVNLTMTNSLVAGNRAVATTTGAAGKSANAAGGGLYGVNASTIGITNSTFTSNSVTSTEPTGAAGGATGGAIVGASAGTLTLTDVTIYANSSTNTNPSANSNPAQGGGLQGSNATVTLHHTIITNNTINPVTANSGPDINANAFVTGNDYNILGTASPCTTSCSTGGTGDQLNVADAKLGPLADNGGPTQTRATLPGSPAADHVPSPCTPNTDQRGNTRPVGASCDTGAYEGPIAPITAAVSYSPTTVQQGQATVLTLTLANPNGGTGNVNANKLTNASFTFTLPAQLSFVGAPIPLTSTCAALGTLAFNPTTLTGSAFAFAPGQSCTFTVQVAVNAASGSYTIAGSNSTSDQYGTLALTPTGTGVSATAAVTTTAPPSQHEFGQSDNTNLNAFGVSTTTLYHPSDVAADNAAGFYVADSANNRVLHFTGTNTTADGVIGQTSFTGNGTGTTANTLNGPTYVAADSVGGVYVADSANNRVLHFPASPRINPAADRVYGQAISTTNAPGTGANGLHSPHGLAVDASGGLYVSDTLNNRALYYPTGATTATGVYGQADFAGSTANKGGSADATTLNTPNAVGFGSDGLYIADTTNNRVLHYATFGAATDPAADRVYGQTAFTTTSASPTQTGENGPSGVALDTLGGLFVGDSNNNRIVYYAPWQTSAAAGTSDPATTLPALYVYGQSNFTGAVTGTSTTTLNRVAGIATDAAGDLFAADFNNNRVTYYPAITSGGPNATLTATPTGTVPRAQTLTYTLTLTNPSATQAITNLQIATPTDTHTAFVTGSVTLDGFAKPGADPINVGLIPPGKTATVVFQDVVDGDVPDNTSLALTVNYTYTRNGATVSGSVTQNPANTVSGGQDPLAAHITYAKITPVDGTSHAVTVTWAARESNILGYDLYDGNVKLNAHIIPAHSTIGQPDGVYSVTVTPPSGASHINIVDVGPGGKTTTHGPYAIGATTGTKPLTPAADSYPSPVATGVKVIRLSSTDAALSVAQDGIYHLTAEALQQQGLDLSGIDPAKLALATGGKSLPLYVKTAASGTFGAGDYIEFVATAQDDFYNGSRIYVLTAHPTGPVKHLAQPPSITLAPKPGDPVAQTVRHDLPGRLFYWASAPAAAPAWNWALAENDVPTLADQNLSFDLPRLYNTGSQNVTVTLHLRGWGGYNAGVPDHHAIADLAGAHGEVVFTGDATATITLTLPASALTATGNGLRLRAPGDLGFQYDTFLLESLTVSYPQAKALPAPQTSVANTRPFSHPKDLAKDLNMQAGGTTLDYLIIANSDFVAGSQPLAQQHRAEGLRVAVVDANTLYDVYGDGSVNPDSLRKAIAALTKERGLHYVLLVGADSIDPRDYAHVGDRSYIPAYHAPDSPGTRAPSDAPFADSTGKGQPIVALGRLPVTSTAELNALVAKTIAFITRSAPASATFVTDPTDPTFAAMTKADAAALPKSANVVPVTWQAGNAGAATQQLVHQWQVGSRIIGYTGHSNAGVWADDDVLDSTQLAAIGQGKAALVAVWGCWAASYDSTFGGESLSQQLLGIADGGAAAVISSSTEVSADQYAPASRAFYAALYANGKGQRIGDALLAAHRAIPHGGSDLDAGLTLLGDPAARI